MHITLVMVSSADGKTTHPTVHVWSSPEDQTHFRTLKHTHTCIIMGRKTYETVRDELKLSPKTLRVVMTKRPLPFAKESVPGQLEFSDETPKNLITRLTAKGYTAALLVGGSDLNEAFLKDQLITDCVLTIEPRFFGDGKSIFTSQSLDVKLQLTDMTRLNDQGTIVLKYTILYEHTND